VPATAGSPIIIDATPSKTSDVAKELHEAPSPSTPVVAPVATAATAERSSIHKVDFKGMLGKLVADYLEGQEFAEMLNGYVQLSVKKEVKKEVTEEVGKQIKDIAKPASTVPRCPALRSNPQIQKAPSSLFKPMNFVIFCNLCEKNITGTHYHCSSCENGDYDVCEECKEAGKHCKEPAHWLIKRQLSNGRVISSTTENVKAEKKEPTVEHPKCNVCLHGKFLGWLFP
jgi:next to BRCA1 gene 1 protein